jgi:hypothetical protein
MSEDNFETGAKPTLLWESLQSMCRAKAEAEFVRAQIGDELFDSNQRLNDERSSLQQILDDMTSGEVSSEVGLRTAGAPLHHARQLAMRDRMRQLLFAADTGSAPFASSRERMVAEYIANGRQRPGSAVGGISGGRPGSRGSRTSSTAGSSRPSSRSTPRPSHADDVSNPTTLAAVAASGKLQHQRVHEVCADLRKLLAEEAASLLDEIEWLRTAIDDHIRWMRFAEPSQQELGALNQRALDLEASKEHAASIEMLPSVTSRRLQPLVPTPPRRMPPDVL